MYTKYLNLNYTAHRIYASNISNYLHKNASGKIITINLMMKICKCTIDVAISLLGYMYWNNTLELINGTHYKII